MVTYDTIYPGASYFLEPNYNIIGYRVNPGEIGGTTSIQTANQLKEVTNLLNQGMKQTELSVINPEVFEMIPKGQLKEIERLNKLTGAQSSLHAPVIDPSGFTQQGWSEDNRESAERQFTDIIKRSHEIDPNGSIPVTIHSSGIYGSEMIPAKQAEKAGLLLPEEKEKKQVMQRLIAVDQSTGQFIPLEREKRWYPSIPQGEIYTPEHELKIANDSYWDEKLSQLVFYKEGADKLLRDFWPLVATTSPQDTKLTGEQIAAWNNIGNAQTYLSNAYKSINTLYNQAYKYSDEQGKQALLGVSKQLEKDFKNANFNDLRNASKFSDTLQKVLNSMKFIAQTHTPEIYKKADDFAREKASETFSSVAINSYKKFGNKSPIISIENPPYGFAISSGEELKNLVEETRKKFVDKLVKEGKSKTEAENAAEKLIGATWDTSHINMIRKQGFGKEKIVEETKIIAPYVKHVHFNDNFGSTHTDLPPGMGNVPMSEVMQELEKKKFKGRKIMEGGGFFQHFQTSPFPYTLETSGGQIYQGGPYWNQAMWGIAPTYMGFGPINPQIHHSLYGSGFTTLPVDLGGEMPGAQSRFSGAPNQ